MDPESVILPPSTSRTYYATLDGQTDLVLPLDDAPDTPYLSHMEVPLESTLLDAIDNQTASPLDLLIAEEEEPIRQKILSHFNWFWEAIEEELTARQFQIFQLRHMYGYTQSKIAEILHLRGGQAVVAQILHVCEVRLQKKFTPLLEPLLRRG